MNGNILCDWLIDGTIVKQGWTAIMAITSWLDKTGQDFYPVIDSQYDDGNHYILYNPDIQGFRKTITCVKIIKEEGDLL